jgi:hypothetical protein
VNQTELGRDVTLPQPTVHRWLNLLETSYLLVRLPAYAVNRTKRLIKAPKIYWGDTGVAMQLAETEEPGGAHMENLVLHDLLAWRDARIEHAELGYWRTSIGEDARERTTKLEAITAWAVFRAKAELSSSNVSPGEVIQRTWEARGLIVGRQLTEGSNAMTGCA